MNHKLMIVLSIALLLAAGILPAAAAPLATPCAPGAAYDPACDVDHDNDVDIFDIQLAAGHWNQTGVWTGSEYWALAGNAGTTPGTHFLGTTDNQALEVRVNGSRALLIQPSTVSPNLIGGYSGNSVSAGVAGATIGGGGNDNAINSVTDYYGTVGGGRGNTASGGVATVGGGYQNTASGNEATVDGGSGNTASGFSATVGGGYQNAAGNQSATVSGGTYNTASGGNATVSGGYQNAASGGYSTVGGGNGNTASGAYATVPGGVANTASGQYSFAAGQRAKAIHDGAFVWADSQASDWSSTAADTFRVRAQNGAWIQANNTAYAGIIDNDGNGDGLRAFTTSSQGNNYGAAYISNSGTSPGLVAHSGGTYAGYFNDQIYVTGGCTGCTLMYVAQNTGDAALEAGDLVAAAGVGSALTGSVDPVLRVQRSVAAAPGVVGVVFSRASVTPSEKEGEALDSVQAADGAAQPGDYLLIVVQGLAQVKVAQGEALTPGQRLTTGATPGLARALRTFKVQLADSAGVADILETAPVIGVALDAAEDGMVWVMVALQ